MSHDGKRKKGAGKRLRHWVTAKVALALLDVVPRFSLEGLQRAGELLGSIAARLPGKRRQRVLDHLKLAFADEADRVRLLRESYQSAVQTFFEVMWGVRWRPERDNQRLRLARPEVMEGILRTARERGTGLVIFTAHIGCSELTSHWFVTTSGLSCMAVAARPKIAALEEPMRRTREASGMKQVYRGAAGSATLRHLKGGGALILMVDHNLKGPGVAVPFFGKGAHTLLAPARLALQSGATVCMMFGLRDGRGRILLECEGPLDLPVYARDKSERFRQEADLTRLYTESIEAAIRRYPGQYLWMHKRWESRSDTLPLPF